MPASFCTRRYIIAVYWTDSRLSNRRMTHFRRRSGASQDDSESGRRWKRGGDERRKRDRAIGAEEARRSQPRFTAGDQRRADIGRSRRRGTSARETRVRNRVQGLSLRVSRRCLVFCDIMNGGLTFWLERRLMSSSTISRLRALTLVCTAPQSPLNFVSRKALKSRENLLCDFCSENFSFFTQVVSRIHHADRGGESSASSSRGKLFGEKQRVH